ncbi:MAG: hypothetical protein WC655_05185 [Candidatus Hydrogenedentales bacterium]|jgi:hypothetical protein
MESENGRFDDTLPDVGLCRSCVYARRIAPPGRTKAYWRCGMSDKDAGYAKYPRLPVMKCGGYDCVTEGKVTSIVHGERKRGPKAL